MFTPRRSMILAFAAALQAAFVSADLASDLQDAGIAATFPGLDSYKNATTSFNLRFDYQPAGVVFPSTKEEVATAVTLAAANNVKVTAKSGGVSLPSILVPGSFKTQSCRDSTLTLPMVSAEKTVPSSWILRT